ncbi:MAG: type Z 30S ribosomal protein S14 [Chloroflexi bacterium]|nr:type Z 30S ribosomal protein S14 [Chloroflexota bacterium]
MAKISQIVKSKRTPKYKVQRRNRCRLCGRPRGYLRHFDMCRICFRKLSNEGQIIGVRKSSW